MKANKPLAKEYKSEHLDVLAKGCPHLQVRSASRRRHGVLGVLGVHGEHGVQGGIAQVVQTVLLTVFLLDPLPSLHSVTFFGCAAPCPLHHGTFWGAGGGGRE